MSVIIQFPTMSPTHSVTIKSPILGDSFTDSVKTNIHVAMSAATVATRRTPTRQKLLMTFRNIPTVCDDQKTALDTFLAVVKGRDIRLFGYSGDMWVGKIITNPLEITYTSVGRAEFTLELVGVKSSTDRLLMLEDESGYLLLEDGNYLLLEENTL